MKTPNFAGLPNPDHAAAKGWKFQLNWLDERNNQCFMRGGDREDFERRADSLRAEGLPVEIVEIPWLHQ